MARLSVLIPSRNERYLNNTIRECFTKAGGEVEVVVCLEGYWPSDWKEITAQYLNLHTVHHGEPRGLRAAINSAAASALSRGTDYLLKLDAHCMLDEGFDIKLQADMDHDWIVVPRRKRLDAENWTLQDVGKPDVDYHYLSFPDDPNDFGGPGLNGKVWEARARERADILVDDEMSSQGSAWACHADYFTKLELMDEESFGKFWNEAQEVLMKAWLSGGRCVVNKKTWYAHLRKSKNYEGLDGKSGRGYNLPESWLVQGRNHTMKWIWNEAWDKQTRPFEWLIDHFWPVPTWPENWREVLYAERKPRAVGVASTTAAVVGQVLTGRDADSVLDVQADQSMSSLKILSARYGIANPDPPFQWGQNSIDVTEKVRSLVSNNSLDIVVNNSTLTPNQNPYRGKKKLLLLTYSYDDGEQITVERHEKDALIIGQPQRRVRSDNPQPVQVTEQSTVKLIELDGSRDKLVDEIITHAPMTAPALNDFLIRRFNISPYRLRAPMPIELPSFHRNDVAKLFGELGFTKGCEVGVAEGHFSEILCQSIPNLEKLYCVDPWHRYSDNPQGHSEQHHEFALSETRRRLAPFSSKVELIQEYSMDAVGQIPYGSLDFCYIDGHHSFDYVMQDLIEWSKRVRSGGIVSGDDLIRLDEKRWGAGPIEAVTAYVNAHRIPIWWTFAGHKSWDFMWVKP